MQIPPSDHVIWSIIRMAVAGVLYLGIAAVAYRNPVSKDDVLPAMGLILGIGAFDKAKSILTKGPTQ